MYKIECEFGNTIFRGTKTECLNVIQAFVEYGISERKLHIIPPQYHDYKIPSNIREKIVESVVEEFTTSKSECGYSYLREISQEEVENMDDVEIYEIIL
jgi:hypothetical protein